MIYQIFAMPGMTLKLGSSQDGCREFYINLKYRVGKKKLCRTGNSKQDYISVWPNKQTRYEIHTGVSLSHFNVLIS